MEYSDYDLIRGIKSGDGDALELLVRRWYPRIFGYVQKTLGNEQDAYDITQEIFLSVVQNIKGKQTRTRPKRRKRAGRRTAES